MRGSKNFNDMISWIIGFRTSESNAKLMNGFFFQRYVLTTCYVRSRFANLKIVCSFRLLLNFNIHMVKKRKNYQLLCEEILRENVERGIKGCLLMDVIAFVK